jgi:phenylalanyl-tRNA synthetase alpha chain
MIHSLEQLKIKAEQEIGCVSTFHELNETKANYLGKKSPLQDLMKVMKDLSIEEKKDFGLKINEFKQFIEEAVDQKRKVLEDELIDAKLRQESIDVTLPGKQFAQGTIHPITQIIEEIEDIFIGLGYVVAEGPEIELDHYNFELLNVPKGHPAREMQDSFFISDSLLLRTHTSPVQARTMLQEKGKPLRIICPGKVYRRDDDDATHSHQFTQIEGLAIDKDITMSDLKGTLSTLVKKMFGNERNIRFRPSFFPFTEPSVEVDISCFKCGGKGCNMCKQSGWIEILGAGMVHPNVLSSCGYDPEVMKGFAFGVGIERIALLRYGIDDIRHLYTNDVRFLNQFVKKG